MEVLYGVGLNPVPYIASSYAMGILAIVGYTAWLIVDRRRLRRLLEAAHADLTTES